MICGKFHPLLKLKKLAFILHFNYAVKFENPVMANGKALMIKVVGTNFTLGNLVIVYLNCERLLVFKNMDLRSRYRLMLFLRKCG